MSTEWEEDGDPWTVKSVSQPFQNDWFKIDSYSVIHPGGADGTYSVIRPRRLAVGVLPVEADGRVHLVGQWRFALGRYSWEMPEGGAEPGEAPLMCAVRELAEETGLRAGELREILEMDLSNSLSDERCIIFLATDLTPGEASPEPTEVLQRRTAPFTELLDRVVCGHIRDSMTVAAVLRAHHMAVRGELPPELAKAMLG
jgi:8-oxo-dGTP pyrophosphatase MutT (NUDIX family)